MKLFFRSIPVTLLLLFVVSAHAQQPFNKILFAKQMKGMVADQKNGFASFKGGKDKNDTNGALLLLKKPVWGAVKSRLEEGPNDDSSGIDSYFVNNFSFTIPAKEKFDLSFVKGILHSIYPAGKYGFSLVDSTVDEGRLYYIGFRVVELFRDSFRLTADSYFFEIGDPEDPKTSTAKQLYIKAILNHHTNKADAGKVSYWAGTGALTNDSLKKIVAKLYGLAKRNRLDSLPITLLKEQEVPTWGDFSFTGDARKLSTTTMKGYSFYIGYAGEFAIVKKLGKDASKHPAEWAEFIFQVGNALPRKFIYMNKFHEEIMKPYLKGKKNGLKVFNGNFQLCFLETDNYNLLADNLLSVGTNLAFEEDEKERKTVYAIINFTVN